MAFKVKKKKRKISDLEKGIRLLDDESLSAYAVARKLSSLYPNVKNNTAHKYLIAKRAGYECLRDYLNFLAYED